MRRLSILMLGFSLTLGTATFRLSAEDTHEKTKIKADGDDYKSKTKIKDKDGKETTKVKADNDDYKSTTTTKTRGKTVKSKTKVEKDDDKVKVKHQEKVN